MNKGGGKVLYGLEPPQEGKCTIQSKATVLAGLAQERQFSIQEAYPGTFRRRAELLLMLILANLQHRNKASQEGHGFTLSKTSNLRDDTLA